MPEVKEVTVQDPTHVDTIVQVAVGPVRGKFKLKVELLPNPSNRRIDMKISGGGFGSAVDLTAGADVVDAGNGTTLLKWSGQAVARGPVAAVGGRVLDAQARKLIEQAFANVRQQLSTA
jgi:carbon monoxide dehydrogenase subunit G